MQETQQQQAAPIILYIPFGTGRNNAGIGFGIGIGVATFSFDHQSNWRALLKHSSDPHVECARFTSAYSFCTVALPN